MDMAATVVYTQLQGALERPVDLQGAPPGNFPGGRAPAGSPGSDVSAAKSSSTLGLLKRNLSKCP